VQLRHESLPMDVSREQHAIGWRHYVERLPVVAAGSDPGPDWN